MVKYHDETGASFQKLKQVLSQYAIMEGFKSELLSRDRQLSENIVQTILSEIQNFLVGESDCEIDQVSGRIETKLAELGADGVSITDESLEKIRLQLVSVFQDMSEKQSDIIDSETENKDERDDDTRSNDEINVVGQSESDSKIDSADKKKTSDLSEQIVDILNNINKDKKLDDFKEFLSTISPKQKHYSLFKRSITAKTLDEILPKVKFFKRHQKMIEKMAVKRAKPILKLASRIGICFEKFNEVFKNLIVNLTNLTKKTMQLTMEVFKLAGTNIMLAGAYLFLAASKMALAVSVITLAAANIVEIATKLVLLASVLVFAFGVMTVIALFAAGVVLSVIAGIAFAFGAIMIMSLLVTSALLASAASLALAVALSVAMTVGSAMTMAVSMVAGAVLIALVGLLLTIPLAAAVLSAGILVSTALILGGGILVAAAYVLSASALALSILFLEMTVVLDSAMILATLSVLSISAVVSASVVSLLTVFTVGLLTQLAVSLVLLQAALISVVAVQTAAILSAVAVVLAAAVTMTLVLLLGLFIVLVLGLQYLWDRVVEELKKTTLYDWWTKDVSPAGGLWEWIKGWFLRQWPWLTDIWGYVKENIVNAFHNTWIYQWWTDEVQAAGGLWSWIKFKLDEAWNWMYDLPVRIWNNFQEMLSNTFKQLLNFKDTFLSALNGWWQESPLRECLESILKWLKRAKDKLSGVAKKAADTTRKAVDAAANTMTFGLVDGVKEIGANYDQATETMADTVTNINRHTNDFVERTSVEKLDAEIERVQKLWENARKNATNAESGMVYAQGLSKLRRKRNKIWLNDALALLQANSTDLQLLVSKRDYLYKWRRMYSREQNVSDAIKRLDDRIAGIKNGSVKITVSESGIDQLDEQRRAETISIPGVQDVKAGEKRRSEALNSQTNTLNSVSAGEGEGSIEKYQPIPVPVPVSRPGNMIFMR